MKLSEVSNTDQDQVQEFIQRNGLEAPPPYRLLDLVAEMGEVAKELLNGSDYGRLPFTPQDSWSDEVGDLYFSLICLANSTGVDLSAALHKAMEKYNNRLRRTGEASSGV